MVRISRVVSLLTVSICAVLSVAAPVFAASWPLRQSAEVICAFADRYEVIGGTTAAHSGVDIAASPNAEVLAIEAGTVSFAGSVPSCDGGTVLAVTVVTDSGDKWSYLPFERVNVEPGAVLTPGAVIGRLAQQGDRSSDVTHLHVGLRCGEHYVDPESRLAVPLAASATMDGASDVVESEPTPAAEPQPIQGDQAVDVAGPSPAPETLSQPQTCPSVGHDCGEAGDATARLEVANATTEQATRPTHGSQTHPGVVSGGPMDVVAVSPVEAESVDEGVESGASTTSALVPRALFAAGCLGLLAVLSSCEAVRERITVLRESVAAAVSR